MFHKLILIPLVTVTIYADCLDLGNNIDQAECYEKQGNTNLAQAAYERAILEDTNASSARVQLATLYQKMQMPSSANAILSELDQKQLSPQQLTSLKALKEREEQKHSIFHSRVTLDMGYDSNININPIDKTGVSSPQDRMDTIFSRATASVSYLYDLSDMGGWYLRTDGELYYQNNISAHRYDTLYGRIYAGGGYHNENFVFYLPLFYDRLNYLDKDLLQESGLRPDLNFQLSSTLILDLYGYYSHRQYIQPQDTFRNDDQWGVGGALFWLKNKNMAYIKLEYLDFIAQDDTPPDYTDKVLYTVKLGAVYHLFEKSDLFADYQFIFGDYAATTIGSRTDYNHDISIALEHDIYKSLRVRGAYRYLYSDSNLPVATYQKNEVLLGLVYNY